MAVGVFPVGQGEERLGVLCYALLLRQRASKKTWVFCSGPKASEFLAMSCTLLELGGDTIAVATPDAFPEAYARFERSKMATLFFYDACLPALADCQSGGLPDSVLFFAPITDVQQVVILQNTVPQVIILCLKHEEQTLRKYLAEVKTARLAKAGSREFTLKQFKNCKKHFRLAQLAESAYEEYVKYYSNGKYVDETTTEALKPLELCRSFGMDAPVRCAELCKMKEAMRQKYTFREKMSSRQLIYELRRYKVNPEVYFES